MSAPLLHTTLARLAPWAAQAIAQENPRLLGAVLAEVPGGLVDSPELTRQMAVAFSLSRLWSPSFVEVDSAKVERVLAQLPESSLPFYHGARLASGNRSALGEAPASRPCPIRVYSDPELAKGDVEGVCIDMPCGISYSWREAIVDIRDLKFIHSLSEGRASALVAEKVDKMKGILKECHDSGIRDAQTILKKLTSGDKESEADQIRAGRCQDNGPFFLINGHRRLTSLCVLALQGEIPCDWLTQIPIWLHGISTPEVISKMTAGVVLESAEVLGEISVGDYSPTEALNLITFSEPQDPKIGKWVCDPKRAISSHSEIEWIMNTYDPAFDDAHELCLAVLNQSNSFTDLPTVFLEFFESCLNGNKIFFDKVLKMLIEEEIFIPDVFSFLADEDRKTVIEALSQVLLSERVTAVHVHSVIRCYKSISPYDDSHIYALLAHSNPRIVEFAEDYFCSMESPDDSLAFVIRALNNDPNNRKLVYKILRWAWDLLEKIKKRTQRPEEYITLYRELSEACREAGLEHYAASYDEGIARLQSSEDDRGNPNY